MEKLADIYLYTMLPRQQDKVDRELVDKLQEELLNVAASSHPYAAPAWFLKDLNSNSDYVWKVAWRKSSVTVEAFPFQGGPRRLERYTFVLMLEPHSREAPSGSRSKYRRNVKSYYWDRHLIKFGELSHGKNKIELIKRS